MGYKLERNKACKFLQEKLHINIEEIQRLLELRSPCSQQLDILDRIIYAFYQNIPKQNIVLLSTPFNQRKRPSLEFIVEEVFAGRGGMCIVNNAFCKLLFEAIGYNAFHVAGKVTNDNDHVITIVKNVVEEGDLYLVEVGCGYPVLQAISLDFEVESPVFNHSYSTFKYAKDNVNGIFEMKKYKKTLHTSGENQNQNADAWWTYYNFTIDSQDFEFFDSSMYKVYSEPGFFHSNMLVNGFYQGNAITFKNYDFYEASGEYETIKVHIDEDDVESYRTLIDKNVPQLTSYFDRAIENFKNEDQSNT